MRDSRPRLVVALALLVAAPLLISACGESEEVRQAKAELELAELKGDLDQMYLALRKLSDSGDDSARARLETLKSAIDARSKMRTARSDHDHEAAVQHASEVLSEFPEHDEATLTLRESGQIFYYLRAAKEAASLFAKPPVEDEVVQQASFEPLVPPADSGGDSDKKFWVRETQRLLNELGRSAGPVDGVVGPKTNSAIRDFEEDRGLSPSGKVTPELVHELQRAIAEKETEKIQLKYQRGRDKARYENLRTARAYVSKARELDPHFKGSVELGQMLERAHTTIAYWNGIALWGAGADLAADTARMYEILMDGLSSSVRYGSPQRYWRRVEPLVESYETTYVTPSLEEIRHRASLVSSYDEGPLAEFVEAVEVYSRAVDRAVDSFLNPTGNIADYRAAAQSAITAYKDADRKLGAKLPPSEEAKAGVESLAQLFDAYDVFENPTTEAILDENAQLFRL